MCGRTRQRRWIECGWRKDKAREIRWARSVHRQRPQDHPLLRPQAIGLQTPPQPRLVQTGTCDLDADERRAIRVAVLLQKIRRNRENDDLDNLLDIMEMYESKGETYDPSEDGFVFSQTQINSRIRARNRERLAEEAFDHLHGDTD